MAKAVGHKLRQERPEKRIAQMIRHIGQGRLHVRIAETGRHIRRWKRRCMRSDDFKPVGKMRTDRLATKFDGDTARAQVPEFIGPGRDPAPQCHPLGSNVRGVTIRKADQMVDPLGHDRSVKPCSQKRKLPRYRVAPSPRQNSQFPK